MKVSSIFRHLFTRNTEFYDLFEEATSHIKEIGKLFKEFVEEGEPARRETLYKQMKAVEHENDELTHSLFNQLSSNFITPFDREDIHDLSGILDDIIDYIWNAAKRIVDFNITEKDAQVIEFATQILLVIEELGKAVHDLRNIGHRIEIIESCDKIHALTSECNNLLDNASASLFSAKTEPIEVVRKLDLYEVLQEVADKCSDAANVLESIIVKYS